MVKRKSVSFQSPADCEEGTQMLRTAVLTEGAHNTVDESASGIEMKARGKGR